MKSFLSRLFLASKENAVLKGALLFFYFVRFTYHAIREKSLFFFRYYPGYHGSTIPSLKQLAFPQPAEVGVADGIELNEQVQLSLLEEFMAYTKDFSPPANKSPDRLYFHDNAMFPFEDGFFLYCFLRKYRPARIVEVGSGHSSALMIDACGEFIPDSSLTFIDPYSTTILDVLKNRPAIKYKYMREEVQKISLDCFQELGADDVLFIDSSHVVKAGSDLSSLFFRILPALKPGVIIHIHDIWFPFEYPEGMVREGCGYNEAFFVRAFLQFNKSFEILFFGSFLQHRHPGRFTVPQGHLKGGGNSLWIRKVA